MISYLPSIYPDELVYSWFCRYYVHSGCFSSKMALDDILYNRHNNPSKEFIGHLNTEFKSKIESIYSIEKLILEHTMFPQYARFITYAKKKEAIYHLTQDFYDAHNLLSIPPRAGADRYLKYCPLCSAEDRRQYGETYWHRTHQIRNMTVCVKHHCYLEHSTVAAISEQTYTLCPAEEYATNKTATIANNEQLIKFSNYLTDVFNMPLNFETDIAVDSALYAAMKEKSYISSTGKTRFTKRLADDIKAFYEKLELPSTATFHQIQRVLLGENFYFSVICQISFYLGIKFEDLIKPTKEKNKTDPHHPRRQAEITDWKTYDDELAPILEQFAENIFNGTANDICRPERVSKRIINLSDYRLSKLPKCRAILARYSESYEENWARRIVWAYNKLKSERQNQPFYWSDIRILSGVKKKNIDNVIPLIQQYTDNETYTEIMKIIK